MKAKGSEKPPLGRKRRQKFGLTKPADVRRMLASIINDCIADEMEIEKGRGIGYLAQILLKAMENCLENRVAELENEVFKKHGKVR
jgi:hypothetical protein